MLRYRPRIFTVIVTVLFIAVIEHGTSGLDPSLYTVSLKGACGFIFHESASHYSISSTDKFFTLPETPFQHVITKDPAGGKMVLRILSGNNSRYDGKPVPGDTRDTAFINLTDHDIINTSLSLQKNYNPVASVETFVYAHIRNKTLGIPLLTARQIFESRSGDCTEHSILSVALLRAMGIPCRAVVGMLLSERYGGLSNVFVYHMWVEAYFRGKWHLVDATRPGKKYLNRYIAFTYHSLMTQAPLSYLKALSAIKNLEVRCAPHDG